MTSIAQKHITITVVTLAVISFLAIELWLDSRTLLNHTSNSQQRRNLSTIATIPSHYKLPQTTVAKTPRNNNKHLSEIRYVAFGTFDTWGWGISGTNRHEIHYPAQLSHPSTPAKNLAMRAAGPNYPSACTYSMIGAENQYDVIILEFFPSRDEASLRTLLRRLRTRFPDALIIMLREWAPIQIQNQLGQSLRRWAKLNGFKDMPASHPAFLKAFSESNDIWEWQSDTTHKGHDLRVQLQNDIAQEYNVVVSVMPRPDNPKDWIEYAPLFSGDLRHKSNQGHEALAQRLRGIVREYGVPSNPRLGTWDSIDNCVNWFESGITEGILMSKKLELKVFADHAGPKYALELGLKKGFVTAYNPANEWMKAYVSYMITSPSPSKYPVTKLTKVFTGEEPIVLDQNAGSDFEKQWKDDFMHVHKMVYIGKIPPGYTTLFFEEMENTPFPFRLVGVLVTNEELLGHPGQPVERGNHNSQGKGKEKEFDGDDDDVGKEETGV